MAARSAELARNYVPRARTEHEVVILTEAARSSSRLQTIPVADIAVNPRNPRATFREEALNELAHSLKEDGQLQPILVRRRPNGTDGEPYELIAGERRWRAAQRAGLSSIQAAVWEASDEESLRLALIENWHRQDLTPSEQIAGLEMLAEAAGNVGVRELSRQLHVAPSTISERLQVRRDRVIWPAVEEGQIPLGHAYRLRRAPANVRPVLLERTLRERPNREELEGWIETARAEHRRSGALGVAATIERMEQTRGVRQSNTPGAQSLAAEQYLSALEPGLDPAARGLAMEIYTRLRDLLRFGPDATESAASGEVA